jgi:hypothetical protein
LTSRTYGQQRHQQQAVYQLHPYLNANAQFYQARGVPIDES